MNSTLGCLFALVVGFIVFFGITFGRILNFILSLFGIRLPNGFDMPHGANQQTRADFNAREQQNAARQNTGSGSAETHTGRQQEKIFTKDESEYVDFEEVK